MRKLTPESFYSKLDVAIQRELKTFRDYVMKCMTMLLYYQNIMMTSAEARSEGTTNNAGEEGWVQINLFQALLTMKQSLMLDFNFVPLIKSDSRQQRRAGSLISTRKAIDCLISEWKLDEKVLHEILNILLGGNSYRFQFPKPIPSDDLDEVLCPSCEVAMVNNHCATCDVSFDSLFESAKPDHVIDLEIISPWWVLPIPMTASSLQDVGVLVKMCVIPRHCVKEKLQLFFPRLMTVDENGCPVQIEIDTDISEDGEISTGDVLIHNSHLSSLQELWNVAKRILELTKNFNMQPSTSFLATSNYEFNRFYVQVWVRKDVFDDCHGDLVIHFLDGRYIGCTDQAIDDHFSLSTGREMLGRLLGDGEDALIVLQDCLNNLVTLSYINAMSNSFSINIADRNYINVDDLHRVPNDIVVHTTGQLPEVDLSKIFLRIPGQGLTQDVMELREALIYNMQVLAQVFPVLFGQLPPGVEAYKAIETLRAQSLRAMRPFYVSLSKGHVRSIAQGLRLAARYWAKPRVTEVNRVSFSVEPSKINTNVQFSIKPNIIAPTGERDKRSIVVEAIQFGLIDITDPLNRIRIISELGLEEYESTLATEIDSQTAEIEKIITTRQAVPITPRVDNHLIHYYVVRDFLRSEYGRYLREEDPLIYQIIELHGQIHALIADGKIEEAASEMAKSGLLSWISRGGEPDSEALLRELEIAVERTRAERKQFELQEQNIRSIIERMGGVSAPPGVNGSQTTIAPEPPM